MHSDDEHESARDKAYKTAFNTISEMRIGEDGFIREEDLVEMAGVSRTPVREALQRLQAEGIVKLVPRKGAYVAAVTPYEIQDLLECRSLFECSASDVVIRERATHVVEKLQSVLNEHYRSYKEGASQRRLIELDQFWHSIIVDASGNKMLSEMYQSLKNRELRLMLTVLSNAGRDRWDTVMDEHQKILAALKNGDAEEARRAIKFHCHQTGQAALSNRLNFAR